jgi:hypothetical protein
MSFEEALPSAVAGGIGAAVLGAADTLGAGGGPGSSGSNGAAPAG